MDVPKLLYWFSDTYIIWRFVFCSISDKVVWFWEGMG